MAKVFISYSRKDIEFAKKLTAELKKSDLDFWIDWEGIPPTVDWWKEIEKGIEEADIFLFLISPDSAKSKICGQEIEVAVKNGKRIVPIVVREIVWDDTPPQLGHLNYIFFSRDDDFNTAVKKLMTAIQTDYEWVATHRRLQVKALEWERNNKEHSYLLRGRNLQDAEIQLVANAAKEPLPTDLQRDYISSSRSAENIQQRISRSRTNVIAIIGLGLLILVVLAQIGFFNHLIYRPVDMQSYWVTIPAGEFLMGSESGESDELPVHSVFLDEYQIGKYEITNRQFVQCVKAGECIGGNNFAKDQAFHPVVGVNWQNAKIYCEWVGGRLPTEAEWEKAASWNPETKTKSIYPWGDTIDCSFANYAGTSNGSTSCVGDTTPVGSYESGKSSYEIYDMAGNVFEWVNDWYAATYYENSPESNPLGPETGRYRVLRSAAWGSNESRVRSTLRYGIGNPSIANNVFGFRCARDTSPVEGSP